MKESDKKNKNTISHIFKKKKTDGIKMNLAQEEENNTHNPLTERLKNKANKNQIKNEINNKDNIISEKKIKSIYVNNNNKNYNITKNKKISNIFNNNKKIDNRTEENKKMYFRYNSNNNINEHNYLSETNYNINSKLNINNNKEQNKNKNKINNNINYNSHNRYINNNETDKTNKSNKNVILLNNYNKSCSLKVLPIKQLNKKNIMIKGIKINGFEKLISKQYTTRNIDIPQYVTDRLKKKINGASSITNSKRYINTSNNNKTKRRIQNKVKGNNK